jgi:hypothetical protein
MEGVPNMQNGGCQPGFKVYCCHDTPVNPELKFTYYPAATYKTKEHKSIELTL